MRRLWIPLFALLAYLWSGPATATTGGDSPIQVLGYAPGDDKVYLLQDPDDGSEAPPQLLYVMVDGPHAGRVFVVRSWYREFEDPDFDRDVARERFATKLARLRKRLVAVKTIAPVCTAEVVVQTQTHVDDPWDPSWDTEYELKVSVAHPSRPRRRTRTVLTAYRDSVDVVAEIRVPGKAIAIVLVRYFSDPYEHGYDSDVALGVPLTARAIARGESAAAVTYHPYGDPDDQE